MNFKLRSIIYVPDCCRIIRKNKLNGIFITTNSSCDELGDSKGCMKSSYLSMEIKSRRLFQILKIQPLPLHWKQKFFFGRGIRIVTFLRVLVLPQIVYICQWIRFRTFSKASKSA